MSNLKHMTKLDSIERKVGKPYYSDDKVLLYNIDCVEFMNKIGLSTVNLTVTSRRITLARNTKNPKT